MRRFYVQVYGCQMNQYEAGVVRAVLQEVGYVETTNEVDADVVLVLTCAVRSHAEQRALGRLGSMRRLRSARPGLVLAALGCMSQNLKQSLVQGRTCDLVVGPDQYRRLPELIEQVRETEEPFVAVEQTPECYEGIVPVPTHLVCGSVTVMRGCDNYCSYCIVPYARGRERSKPLGQVLAEASDLARRGIKDLTLLGQNVLAYHSDGHDFVSLLQQVSEIRGLDRVRFLTSHPKDLSRQVLQAMARLPRICPALHLPVQSGSNRILAMMNRGYTREEYQEKVSLAREILPELGLTTDVMVGFPSETEEDFQDTLDLIRHVRFDHAYMFRFSARPGTAAAGLQPKVSEADASRRLSRLIETQNRITTELNSALVGRTIELLVEACAPRGQGMLGRTRNNRTVIVHGPTLVGQTVSARITGIKGWTPLAEIVFTEAKPEIKEALCSRSG